MVTHDYSFNPNSDIPSLSDKVILVTGGTAGIGTETIVQLVKHNPDRIYFTGRNASSAENVIQSAKDTNPNVQVTFVACDFTSLQSVYEAGKRVTNESQRLDILICNAGVMAIPKTTTKDGYEVQFGVNHLAHALLIKTLLPLMLHTTTLSDASVRIVILSSLGFRGASTIDFPRLKSEQDMGILGPFMRYGQSKLANVLYAKALAKRYPDISSVSIHPGIIKTGMFQAATTFWRQISVQDGAKNSLWAATVKKEKIKNGAFYEPVGQMGGSTKASRNADLAEKLWEWTEEQLKDFT
ncbi:dehydrogenase with different specificitie [Lojkania enalia]|uniref:Dehydrogenase with different specificitie n=1 Tax=Lojkania enalia TaxID=147567 RepID=A0A9P4TQ30_9PLEO|nr:dehydrogenase with different specificitie [Didymosphaeria enalia]